MRKRTSLKDIAKEVGVSTTLVSYVLNDKMQDRINKVTAKRIKKAAVEMGYRPNQIAQSLKNNKTRTIGLIIADIANPFSSSLARIIEDEAKESQYSVIFGSADESSNKAESLIDTFLSRQVDGFIIAPPQGFERQLVKMGAENIPVVLIDRYFKSTGIPYVTIDNYSASYNAVKHLISNGFENIGFINYKTELIHLQERTRGYKEALKETNISLLSENVVEVDENNLIDEIRTAIDLLIKKNKVDALFFSSSIVAIEGLTYLRELNAKIPEDVGVVCFDETPAYGLFQYPLTYIKQPLRDIGQKAVKLLLDVMNNRKIDSEVTLDAEMIIQNSSQRK